MEARIIHNVIFFLICVSFSPLTVKTRGDIPIVNPTIPAGVTPIVTPRNPPAPTTSRPPTTTGPPASGSGLWCVANPSASENDLQVALDYACGYAAVDCSPIQSNGGCYDPNTARDHASYAFNYYYSKNPAPTSCVFGGAAQLTNNDPSHGSCLFPSSSGTSTTPPSTNPPPTLPMPPPSPTTPVNPYPPAGSGSEPTGYDYGSEPTGTPSSSKTISLNLLLLITMNCFILSVSIANYS